MSWIGPFWTVSLVFLLVTLLNSFLASTMALHLRSLGLEKYYFLASALPTSLDVITISTFTYLGLRPKTAMLASTSAAVFGCFLYSFGRGTIIVLGGRALIGLAYSQYPYLRTIVAKLPRSTHLQAEFNAIGQCAYFATPLFIFLIPDIPDINLMMCLCVVVTLGLIVAMNGDDQDRWDEANNAKMEEDLRRLEELKKSTEDAILARRISSKAKDPALATDEGGLRDEMIRLQNPNSATHETMQVRNDIVAEGADAASMNAAEGHLAMDIQARELDPGLGKGASPHPETIVPAPSVAASSSFLQVPSSVTAATTALTTARPSTPKKAPITDTEAPVASSPSPSSPSHEESVSKQRRSLWTRETILLCTYMLVVQAAWNLSESALETLVPELCVVMGMNTTSTSLMNASLYVMYVLISAVLSKKHPVSEMNTNLAMSVLSLVTMFFSGIYVEYFTLRPLPTLIMSMITAIPPPFFMWTSVTALRRLDKELQPLLMNVIAVVASGAFVIGSAIDNLYRLSPSYPFIIQGVMWAFIILYHLSYIGLKDSYVESLVITLSLSEPTKGEREREGEIDERESVVKIVIRANPDNTWSPKVIAQHHELPPPSPVLGPLSHLTYDPNFHKTLSANGGGFALFQPSESRSGSPESWSKREYAPIGGSDVEKGKTRISSPTFRI